ncbi:lamin tail domain-containing protein [Patescibacteria group bacterium]|nr:lamin tail domain-containing protein [Patescibacteria group bacterium]MBU1702904.1 lamin tail domain-containing protein [Patescibacteria group bacterium]MBU1953596.1 lamin tail domain-containing protein [Patescibacteria group bacterium]
MKKKKLVGLTLLFWLVSFLGTLPVSAAAAGSVVISEVAWAGSADSANDEWIELYNTTAAQVDLSGWTIVDDGVPMAALSGVIAAHGYFLIEKSEGTVNPNVANEILNLSLANSGDSLVLKDGDGAVIDTVNSSGGAWFAGDSVSKASMERIDALVSGDSAGNWAASSGAGSTATASLGSLIVGTPGLINSVSSALPAGAAVSMSVSDAAPATGDNVTLSVDISGAADLFSYGLQIDYDPAVLSFVSAAQGDFLGESAATPSSFQSGLENFVEGKLLVAEARTIDPKTGVNGNGNLFTATFKVEGGEGQQTNLSFASSSFTADTSGDVTAAFSGVSLTPKVSAVDDVANLTAVEGANRYELALSWDAAAGADGYMVYRKGSDGGWVYIGQTSSTAFVDSDAVNGGGKLIPFVNYGYEVKAVRAAVTSVGIIVNAKETRGLKGDNDRSDRVDGRDLDRLARHFAESAADNGFDPLIDTNYDGLIDGSDLIDIGANFALVYGP